MIRLSVRAPAEAAEAVLGALLELAPAGVEQRDGAGWVEYAVYGAPGELPSLPEGDAEIAGATVRVRGEEVPDDFSERWMRFHTGVLVGGRLWVRPPWEPALERPGVEDIVVDPGQAFGTGAHPTTRGCLELLLGLEPAGSLVDLGCGSGVIAITASRLGFGPVTALDHERAAVEATEAGARANGVRLARVALADLREHPAPAAHVITANLMRPLLLRVATLMTEPPRWLILSGLLDHEADEVVRAFAHHEERRRISEHGWTSVLLEATAAAREHLRSGGARGGPGGAPLENGRGPATAFQPWPRARGPTAPQGPRLRRAGSAARRARAPRGARRSAARPG
ncbi:MAG: 50S ribosomal protein L11 methyltransferase [Thermoleophilaceae bacterium]